MSDSGTWRLSDAVTLKSYTDRRFKTMRLSVDLLLPLRRETAARYGILPGLVTRATREYPDFAALNRKLAELYGASLHTSVRKMGGFHCLTLAASGIASRYAFDGDDMMGELSALLFSALFSPLKDSGGAFPEEHFRQEQRQLLELKDAEFNDKVTYAHQRCEELLFDGQDAGADRYGSRVDIASLDRLGLSADWDEALSSARVVIFALGDCQPDPEMFRQRFSGIGRYRELTPLPFEEPMEVRRVTEEQPVSQSKLSLAFRVDAKPEERLLFQLVNAVLGGVPTSKLFQNVREKLGLCYYCSSAYSALSRTLFVDSGVETEDLDRTEQAIMTQLDALQKGDITEEELLSAKLALCNSFRSVGDSLGAVESWRLSGMFFGQDAVSPEEASAQVMTYTAQEVAVAAQRLKLATVYRLKGRENG